MSPAAARKRVRLAPVLGVVGLLAACGGGSHSAPQPAAPAAAPHGSAANDVSYRCAHGRSATISVDLPDPRKLAEVLNPINVCEYDGGLSHVDLDVTCGVGQAARHVRVVAVNGELPKSTSRTVCGP